MSAERKLKLLEAKRELYFSQISNLFRSIGKLSDERTQQVFLSQARHSDKLRAEYVQIVDDINLLNLEINPDFTVKYQSVSAYDELFFYIKEAAHRYEAKTNPSADQASSAVVSALHRSEQRIKIPSIKLPAFDGEIENFPFFFETFKQVIHDNMELNDSERVHYLLSHLTGKARNICAGVVPAGENYNRIWDALVDKYKDDRALASTYLNQLLSFESVNSTSASSLEGFVDKFAAILASLNQLKIPDLSDFIFVHLGLKLVDVDTAKNFEMSIRGETEMPRCKEFLKFVREQVKILERTSKEPKPIPTKTCYPASASSTHNINARQMMPQPHGLGKAQQTWTTRTQSIKQCNLCESSAHAHMFGCSGFQKLSPLDRLKFVKDKRLCVNCLSSRHTTFYCRSTMTCRKCKAGHHTLLHFSKDTTLTYHSTVTAMAVKKVGTEGDVEPLAKASDSISLHTITAFEVEPSNQPQESAAAATADAAGIRSYTNVQTSNVAGNRYDSERSIVASHEVTGRFRTRASCLQRFGSYSRGLSEKNFKELCIGRQRNTVRKRPPWNYTTRVG